MMKKIFKVTLTLFVVMLLISCKNTKQKLQEYVVAYNETIAPGFRAENVTLTTARGYINDSKIELRFETNLKQNESKKVATAVAFARMRQSMIKKEQIPTELIEEGVEFHLYYLADDNTVLSKEVLTKESLQYLK